MKNKFILMTSNKKIKHITTFWNIINILIVMIEFILNPDTQIIVLFFVRIFTIIGVIITIMGYSRYLRKKKKENYVERINVLTEIYELYNSYHKHIKSIG